MTPEQVKNTIRAEYELLKEFVREGKMSESHVYNRIRASARDGAKHNGVPDAWRDYVPVELRLIMEKSRAREAKNMQLNDELTYEQTLKLRRRLRERVFNLPPDEVIALAKKYGVPLRDK